jgi:hypothetical protein
MRLFISVLISFIFIVFLFNIIAFVFVDPFLTFERGVKLCVGLLVFSVMDHFLDT